MRILNLLRELGLQWCETVRQACSLMFCVFWQM